MSDVTEEELDAVSELDVRLQFDDEGFAGQMMSDTAFSPEDIDSAMIQQAGLYAFYAEQSQKASKRADNLKLKISIVEAEVDKEIRDKVAEEGGKITEKAIDKEIVRTAKYVRAVMNHNDAKAVSQMIRDMLEAFKHKKDMLIQIGVAKREERGGQTRVATAEKAQENMEERRNKFKTKAA